MVYDGYGYDESSNYVCLGRYTTNVGVVQFQMDSYVDLAPTDPYETDDALVGEDQSTTLTLTLQNPRSDGCATAGYWQLDFMTTTYVRVYDAQGAEILPGSKHYDVVTGSQDQITLTVVGQTGGVDDITACWTVWDGTHRVFEPDGSFVDVAGWCFFATDTATVDVVALVWVNNDNQHITGKQHISVADGQRLVLSVIGVPNTTTATYQWSTLALAVKDYDPSKTTAQVTWLQDSDYRSSTISYAWYAAGEGRKAEVTVDGVTLVAWFDVSAPEDYVEATANQLTGPGGSDGVNTATSGLPSVAFGYCANGTTNDGMTFSANHDNMCPDLFAGFEACFCQILHSAKYEYFDSSWNSLFVDPNSMTGSDRLDGQFPYGSQSADGFHAVDSPAVTNLNSANFLNGNQLLVTMSFTMWHMCKPTDCDGIWVPLAKLDWTITFVIQYDFQNSVFHVERASHTPEQYKVFDATTVFPTWTDHT